MEMSILPPHERAQRVDFICSPCALNAGAKYRIGGSQMELFDELCGACGRRGTVAKPREFEWPKPEKKRKSS